ncbi:MAG: septum formation inhibitor Maf [Sulfurospirillum sp.]|nr:septum formation inhibitor Maf [Sulfurospirillum sp.]
MVPIILASNSSTRADILREAGVSFEQKTAFFDEESLDIQDPKEFVYRATLGKMNAFLQAFSLTQTPILCADTVVSARGVVLRKAKDVSDARAILLAQSGQIVSILSCMVLKSYAYEFVDLSSTEYTFKPFDPQDLEAYLQTDDWRGKAGACMVEGFCKTYIDKVQGFQSTAMGLCVEKLLPFLKER